MQITALDQVVATRTIGELRAEVIAAQARRSSGADSGTYWYALATPPRLLFEHVIRHLRTLVPHGGDFVGAEWWCRATTTDAGFPFHFDRDEGIRTSIVSPDVASILYLGDAGGPTLIVDATPTRTRAPRAAIAVRPSPGRFVMFPGALLHGVLPGRASRWPRITLLVNWWRTVPRMEPARDRRFARRLGIAAPRTSPPRAAVEAVDPARVMAKAAWRDLLAAQATYR